MTPSASAAPATLRSVDIDEHAQRLVGWRQDYSQLTPGRFEGTVLHADLHGIALVGERTNQRLRERFTVPEGEVVIAVPIAPSAPAHWGDARLDDDAVAVCRGGAPSELLTPRDFEIVGVVMRTPGPACDALRPGAPRSRVDAAAARALRVLFAEALDALRVLGPGEDLARARLARAVAEAAGAIAERIAAPRPVAGPEAGALSRRLALVRRAEAFVDEHPDAAPTVAELCRATGACRRTLQASFVDVLGIGPSRYLRALRLNRARADLKRDPASVSEVAARWGFWHFGRFASDYRAMFGERPSETLERVRGRAVPMRPPADFG
ncbi:MAG: helix-turn-helix domain-containing protein [Burkholderiales bacterium]